MKKLVSFLTAAAIAASMLCVPAYAEYDTPETEIEIEDYAIFISASSNMTAYGSTLTCTSVASASNVSAITATQTIEVYSGYLWLWSAVPGIQWTQSSTYSPISMTNTASGMSSGTYRLKTDFTVTTKSGKSENCTVYSSEVTI